MILSAYLISGQAVGIDLQQWDDSQLNGNKPFLVENSLTPGYRDISSAVNFGSFGQELVGSVSGFRDYLALRKEIYTRIEAIAGTDYALWNNLSPDEKSVALTYAPTRIVNARGITFFVTECGSQEAANAKIDNYLNVSEEARILRYNAFSNYGYTYLGKTQGLSAEDRARHDFLDTKYMVRGVLFTSEDGIEGLGDWVLGLNGYAANGLKPLIIAGTYTLPPGVDVNVFCDTLVDILEDGLY